VRNSDKGKLGNGLAVDDSLELRLVDALADWIDTKGRRLSRSNITHGHGGRWLGLARLIKRFPRSVGWAAAEVLAQMTDTSISGYWEAIFPGEIPTSAEKVLP